MTTDTIGRWLRMVLDNSSIDTTVFWGHSTRAAATSAAKYAAGWANAKTFSKFYDKPIIPDKVANFGHALLKPTNVA